MPMRFDKRFGPPSLVGHAGAVFAHNGFPSRRFPLKGRPLHFLESVAQSAEQRALYPEDGGSTPSRFTKERFRNV